MKEGRKPKYPEKTPGHELQKLYDLNEKELSKADCFNRVHETGRDKIA